MRKIGYNSKMARFSPQILDQIRDRLTLSEIVGRRVTYDKRKSQPQKGDFWACCPFHNEKTPSFHVDDRKAIYHCFGCGASGDHFRFLTEKEGLSFPEAVERLADEAGVMLPKADPRDIEREKVRASLYDVTAMAQNFFVESLKTAEAAEARAYLQKRGMTLETQRKFGVGFAPKSRNALKQYLAAKGVDQAQMVEAGLIVAGNDIPVSYDKFRDRIMFPILDLRERVIAFGGRAMSPDNPAKYMNSPETPLFSKRTVLYNGARARKAAYERKRIIVVEGYMDVIALAQVGIDEAVAPLGTALTTDQIQLLWKMNDEPFLCFDGDEAGLRAANRSIDTVLPLLSAGKSLKFAFLPTKMDPDDLIREKGVEAFELTLDEHLSLHAFLTRRHQQPDDLKTPERRAALEKRIFNDIAQIADKSVAHHYRSFAKMDLLKIFSSNDDRFQAGAHNASVQARKIGIKSQTIDRLVLGLITHYPWLVLKFDMDLTRIDFGNPAFVAYIQAVRRLVSEADVRTVSAIYESLPSGFHEVLHSVHGVPEKALQRGEDARFVAHERGFRLKNLFPGLRYEPPDDLLEKTMDFHLRKLTARAIRDELSEAGRAGDLERVMALSEEAAGYELGLTVMEENLDEEYVNLRKQQALQAAAPRPTGLNPGVAN